MPKTLQAPNIPTMKAYIEAQGSLLSLKVTGFKSRANHGGGVRGIIRTFSRASRRRLMRFMARLKVRKIRATFLTLTFTEMVSHAEAKRAFKQFAMRIRRKFVQVSVVWRLEYQPKRGAIHYHLLAFNMPFWKQSELQECWEDCTGESTSICDIRLVHGARSVMGYVSKYIAKIDNEAPTSLDDGSYQHEGREPALSRFWGYINKECLPLGQKLEGILIDRSTIKSLSSFMWALIGSDNPYNSISAHLFADNARWLCERAVEEGGMWEWECEYTTKDLTTPKPEAYDNYTSRFSEAELQHDYAQCTVSSKAERSELVQPLIRSWLAPSSKVSSTSRVLPYFDEYGKMVINTEYKGE